MTVIKPMVYLYFFLTCCLPPVKKNVTAHDFHVSKLDIRHNTRTSGLELTLHVFIDDLEMAMKKNGHAIKQLSTGEDAVEIQAEIAKYVTGKIKLFVNQQPVVLSYLGKEEAEQFDAVYLYLEVKNVKTMQSISLDHRLMVEVFDDQKNIVAVYKDKELLDYSIFDLKETKRTIRL